jgi:pimeloyl-ACP methyl ester carboxylesterase
MFGLGIGEDDTQSSADSVIAGAIMSQALLDRLEKGSTPSSPDPTISASPKAIRLSQLDPMGVTELNRQTSSPTPRLKRRSLNSPSPRPMSSPEDHAMAVYLSSARLNRYVHLPRPFPERPLKVSIAEVGQATGTPVLVFLGLGCVRYLIALFDDLAKALKLRLICIDRWGYGKTDNVPEENRTTASWAMVVERVLAELDIDHFRIIAHSAGCPYAAAVALRLGDRVKGKLNFLAPWVNADTDGGEFDMGRRESKLMMDLGYKWLKWVPNGVIKGAVAAEWRLQSYRLGKTPPLVHRPISHIAETPSSTRLSPERSWSEGVKGVQQRKDSNRHTFHGGSPEVRGPSLMRRASQVLSGRVESTAIAGVAASTVGVETRSATPPKSRLRNLRSLTPLRTHSETGTQPTTTPSTSLSSNATSSELQSPHHDVTLSSVAQIGLTEGFDPSTTTADLQYLALPHIDRMTLDDTASSPSTTDKPVTGPALTHALMQASHAECEPGTTKDLLTIVLNKSAQGDEGGYIGVTNPVSVWWGDEDEKISEKSIRWLEKGLAQSGAQVEVNVVQGEGHNLMTCSQVMCEVFLGIYKDVKVESASGSFQPRSREGHPRAR